MDASFNSLPDGSTWRSFEEFMKWMEEWNRKREADHLEYMERSEAKHQEHLKRMEQADRRIDEIKHGLPISYPIVTCTIPSPPVQ